MRATHEDRLIGKVIAWVESLENNAVRNKMAITKMLEFAESISSI